jgi:transposase
MERVALGIDVGKTDLHCALLVGGKTRTNTFSNNLKGFERLVSWLTNRRIGVVHACMEATGGWSDEIGVFLHERNHVVSIVNPSAIKAFGECELSRTKTDKADAALIARYCVAMRPKTWQPPSPARRRLQRLTRRRTGLVEMRTQESNRLESPGSGDVRASIETMIGFLDKQIAEIDKQIRTTVNDDDSMRHDRALLESIPGIGERVATTLLGEIPNIVEFRSGKQLAAFVGLCPREHQSGSRASRSWLAKSGNRHVRKVLYMPALTAMRYNPILSAFCERLYGRGKRPMQVVAAVMRRLLVIAYGVLKSGKPFSATIALS